MSLNQLAALPRASQPYLEWPIKITISVTHRCDLDCMNCYANCRKSVAGKELSTDQWLTFIDYLVGEKFTSVMFEGGEPMVRPDMLQLIERCTPYMLTWLRTHGTQIDSELAKTLKSVGLGTIVVDIWGSRPETHDQLKGAKGNFESACRAVEYCRAADLPVVMTLILCRQNYHELQDYLLLAKRLGVDRVGILRLYPLGRAKEDWDEVALPLADQMSALRGLEVPAGIKLMQSWHPRNGNCCWGSAAVNAYGDSIGCVYLRDFVNFGNILETPFLETWKHPLYTQLRQGNVTSSCSECSKTQGSYGGCRSTAFAFTGRWDAPDPFDEGHGDGIDLTRLPKQQLPQAERH